MSKSGKLRMAAKLIGIIGCVACLIGGAAYCVLTLPEIINFPFEWFYLIIDGAALVVFAAVCIALNLAANSVERREKRAQQEEETLVLAEEEALVTDEAAEAEEKALTLADAEAAFVPASECCLECDFAETCDYLADEKARFIEAYLAEPSEEEDDEDIEEVIVVKKCCPMMAAQAEEEPCEKIVADVRQAVDKAIVAVKENATKIVIPVAAACVATLMVANAKKNKKRKVELKRMQAQAKFRQDFFKWLG